MPRIVTLSFLGRLNPASTTAVVTGPDGAEATSGTPGVKGNKVSVGVRPGAAGRYRVAYQVSSVDGHRVKGEIHFTVTAVASPAPASPAPASGAPAPPAGDPAVAASGAPAADFAAAPPSEGRAGWLPWLLAAVVMLVAGAAGFYRVRRRAAP